MTVPRLRAVFNDSPVAVQGLLFLAIGAVAALGLAPQSHWFGTLLALAMVFAALPAARTPRHSAIWLWLFGLGYFAVALRWLIEPFPFSREVTEFVSRWVPSLRTGRRGTPGPIHA